MQETYGFAASSARQESSHLPPPPRYRSLSDASANFPSPNRNSRWNLEEGKTYLLCRNQDHQLGRTHRQGHIK